MYVCYCAIIWQVPWKTMIEFPNATSAVLYFSLTQRREEGKVDAL